MVWWGRVRKIIGAIMVSVLALLAAAGMTTMALVLLLSAALVFERAVHGLHLGPVALARALRSLSWLFSVAARVVEKRAVTGGRNSPVTVDVTGG